MALGRRIPDRMELLDGLAQVAEAHYKRPVPFCINI